ncbi:MAG: cobalamin biosynthesis protein CobD, partial [Acholeplasmataceae bacterium]|nr:cobalamin biosynthesis protein CobD [Acholeplasmataceae bacterium]
MLTVLAIASGFILDLIFGDPHWLPHPICLIGNLIAYMEKLLRKIFGSNESNLLVGGLALVLIVTTVSFSVPYFILKWAGSISPLFVFVLETIMFYQIFATKCLENESMKVYTELKKGDLAPARKQLSWIVGRDTQDLSDEEVTKAAVETVAENTADGIIAPMFFMFIGGAPLAFLYKSINTMDSMVGYKNEKYLYFGRCAAKLDDIANYIPARLAGIFMIAASFFLNYDYKEAAKIFMRDRYNHLSPNSAQTESVCAGALNIQLGGGHFYFGKFVPKDTIGDDIRPVKADDIKSINNLMYLT